LHIDHINGVPIDNRLSNIREATNTQNQRNRGARHGPIRSNRTGYRGVSRKSASSWVAQISGRSLGTFKTALEAHMVYETAARELHGEFYQEQRAS
jgi:hypothetical protein